MILGAGPYQLPGIKKAISMGFYVISVDNNPESIGHKYSTRFVNCSTVDEKGVLKAAREFNVDGIVTFASDVAVPTVGFVVDRLGLPGAGLSVSNVMTNKAKFRKFQRENKLNHPNFIIAKRLEDIKEQIERLTFPLLFKPVDTSGSRGIRLIKEADPGSYADAFDHAKMYSRSKTVCVEEYVNGIDVSGDGFLSNGRLAFAAITKKYKSGFVVTGHRLPTGLSVEEQNRVFAEVAKTCATIGYTEGPLDFDARITNDDVTILELSPRLGGNGIPMIIERAMGVDLISSAIQLCIGDGLKLPQKSKIKRSCGSLIFGSDIAGIIEHMATDQEVKDAVPEVFECLLNFKIGNGVSAFTHGGNSIGYILFDCPDRSRYSPIVKRIKGLLRIEIRSK
jgi:formate-dependent phosphoribosylglycinamide formyltransferase (GAR transformylase)